MSANRSPRQGAVATRRARRLRHPGQAVPILALTLLLLIGFSGLAIDGALAFRGISEQVASEMMTLAPFGAGNPRPVFRAIRVEVVDGPRRIKDRHLKMAFKQDGRIMRGVAWRAIERESFVTEHRSAIDLAFSLDQDTWNGERYLQLSIADFKEPES